MSRIRTILSSLTILLLLILINQSQAPADNIVYPTTFVAGQTLPAASLNANFAAVSTVVNGNITNANIKSSAAIAASKIDFTTGTGLPLLAHRLLTAAEIKLLHTTPITIVAASGAGTINVPWQMFTRLNYGTVPFTNGGVLQINNTGNGVNVQSVSASVYTDASYASAVGGQNVLGIFTTNTGENKPLVITTSIGDPANGDSTLDVWLVYYVCR